MENRVRCCHHPAYRRARGPALGVRDELKLIRDEIEGWKPHVVFILLEQFHGEVIYDQNVASYLELMRIPYTGCKPRGLVLARGKDLSKTLVHYHRIPVPAFAVFPMPPQGSATSALTLPLIVKSVSEDSSSARAGIRRRTDDKLAERVAFIHERIGTAAIAEQYIEGRELYVGVLGTTGCGCCRCGNCNSAIWLKAHGASLPRRSSMILITERRASCTGLPRTSRPTICRIQRTAKRIYRTLELDGYARIDFRLSAEGTLYSSSYPILRSRRAKNLRRRLGTMASPTRTCCIGFCS